MTVAQDFVTIVIPFTDDTAWSPLRMADVERVLYRLGNPAEVDIAKRLDGTGIIHFLSINVIAPEREGTAPHLLIEATVDGAAQDAVPAIAEALGDALLPALRIVTGVTDADAVPDLLRHHASSITSNPLRLPRQVIGLPFCGTPGVSVAAIRDNQRVVDAARDLIARECLRQPSADAQALLGHVAANLPSPEQAIVCQPQPELAFVDRPDAPWRDPALTSWGLATFWRIACYHRLLLLALLGVPYALLVALLRSGGAGLGTAFAAALVPALIAAGAVVGLFVWLLRRDELANTPIDTTPDPHAIAAMLARENEPGVVQNHMISVTRLRPAAIRRLSLSVAFKAVATLIGTQLMRPGFLSSIGTIHAARWVVLPGTRQLVFLSNFDGSWESYLEDFIKKASEGVSAVWSNAIGFPATRLLFMGGAADGDRMKRFARNSMQPTAFWYSAYPGLTCGAIRKHAMIVSGLRHAARMAPVPADAQAWLDLIGAVPRPAEALQYAEIQAIAFGGLRHHPRSRMIALDFGAPQATDVGNGHPYAHVQRWLADLHAHDLILFGDRPVPSLVANIAFSAAGLARLGLDAEVDGAAQGFPGVFASGMVSDGRRRALGDPEALQWSDASVHAVLLLYARPPADSSDAGADLAAKTAFDAEVARAEHFGLAVRASLDTGLTTFDAAKFAKDWRNSALPDTAAAPNKDDGADDQDNADGLTVEPFGFVDGVSQPQVRGFPGRNGAGDPIHAVEPGEFILGYTDNLGFYPPSPLVTRSLASIGMAPEVLLDAPAAHQPTSFCDFTGEVEPARDFGRNGSYLVIRQLDQDVAAFNQQLTDKADALARQHAVGNPHPGNLHRTREWIAAKLVGRWRDGSPLIEHPIQPVLDGGQTALASNGFALGSSDPQGQRCPFGAHIRRAFPRDSLSPGDPLGLAVTNRHRILRRGRPYRDAEGNPAGTLFMCLNADIERQFEFVQQTWIGSPTFHGLEGERDPFTMHVGTTPIAPGGDRLTIPGPAGGCVIDGLARHVTVRGGGYFFLPGRRALRFLGGQPWAEAQRNTPSAAPASAA
ncbi:hypothetical protein [Novosphingobium sp. FKTRR1]|uniref:Dyp-type peroxidase n=1 Tax=Novosphingobium sp. FKTRR1 TaxID=2879118 RepID=UPI001CEFBA00|nr:hypothetical protein [Novosphingobium sp. FKTRR1]